MRRKIRNELGRVDFDIDVNRFKSEIEKLTSECKVLKDKEETYKLQIAEHANSKIRIEAQLEIVENTLNELNADYEYWLTELVPLN